MPKVKLFRMVSYDQYDSYYDSYDKMHILAGAVDECDWEEVTDEERQYLVQYIRREFPKGDVILIEKMDGEVTAAVEKIRAIIEKEKEHTARAEAERKRKAAERAIKKKAKTEQEQRKLYEALKEVYEGSN